MIPVGVSVRDITPPAGLKMAGFGARVQPATGAHDRLSARALAVGDTALVALDVVGLAADSVARIRAAAGLEADRVIVAAIHTHGGPATMAGRMALDPDPDWLARAEAEAARALREAMASRRPCRLTLALGRNATVGRNRRHAGGITDPTTALIRFEDAQGRVVALLANYACHPVTLGPDNLLWTADYPHFLREALEAAHPGAHAVFVNGYPGDVNTGHSALASQHVGPDPARTFARAAEIGAELARDFLAAPARALDDTARGAAGEIEVTLARSPAEEDPDALVAAWTAEREAADPSRRIILDSFLAWAREDAHKPLTPQRLGVTVLDWGGAVLAGLPGEMFTRASLDLRAALAPRAVIPVGYAGDDPGYIPPRDEYPFGGYEVSDAHRFHGMPAAFAPGTSEALVAEAARLAAQVA